PYIRGRLISVKLGKNCLSAPLSLSGKPLLRREFEAPQRSLDMPLVFLAPHIPAAHLIQFPVAHIRDDRTVNALHSKGASNDRIPVTDVSPFLAIDRHLFALQNIESQKTLLPLNVERAFGILLARSEGCG